MGQKISRRAIVQRGAASMVIAGLPASGCAVVRSDLSQARAPWLEAGDGFDDPRLDALSYAILAPNPHNRQPWLARLVGDDAIVLTCDPSRLLPETDPYNRQITIGFGAFLELMRQAGAEAGYRVVATPFPEGEPFPRLDDRPIANVQMVRDEAISPDPLFSQVLKRRTSRLKFDQHKPAPAGALAALGDVLRPGEGDFEWVSDHRQVEKLKALCRRGWEIEATTGATHMESVRLMRIGQAEVNKNPDGVSLIGPAMEAMRLTGIISRRKLANMDSAVHKQSISFYNGLIDSAMAFGWLGTDANTRLDQLNVGAGWVRVQLAATAAGLAMHPLSQVLQEFPEMAGPFEEIHAFAGRRAPARVQGLFRFGYAGPQGPAPRWPLRTRLISS